MKKFILIILIPFFLLGCPSKQIIRPPMPTDDPSYVFEKVYEIEEQAQSIQDIFKYYKIYNLDSIPISEWSKLEAEEGTYDIVQYISYADLDSLMIIFTYSVIDILDEQVFQVKIRKKYKKKIR